MDIQIERQINREWIYIQSQIDGKKINLQIKRWIKRELGQLADRNISIDIQKDRLIDKNIN